MNLKDIRPAIKGVSDKFSWNLYKWLNNKQNRDCNFDKVYFIPSDDNDKFDLNNIKPSQILIGNRWSSTCIAGRMLNSILGSNRVQTASYTNGGGWRIDLAIDITDDFFRRYIEIGRCLFFSHNDETWIVGESQRYEYSGNNRICKWCGHEQFKTIEEIVVTKQVIKWNDK